MTVALFFDTETTGLVSNRVVRSDKLPEIIEFYGCVADPLTGKVFRELNLLIQPKNPITEEITRITGITNDMVREAPMFPAVAGDIVSFLESGPSVVGHNVSFDKEMIEIELARIDMKILWPPALCTIEQTIHLKGFRLNLSDLHKEMIGEPLKGAHRAKVDVLGLVACYGEMIKRDMV